MDPSLSPSPVPAPDPSEGRRVYYGPLVEARKAHDARLRAETSAAGSEALPPPESAGVLGSTMLDGANVVVGLDSAEKPRYSRVRHSGSTEKSENNKVEAPDLPFMRYPRSRVKGPDVKLEIEEASAANVAYLNKLKNLYGANFSSILSGGFEATINDTDRAPIAAAEKELLRMGVIADGLFHGTGRRGVRVANKTPWPAQNSLAGGSERSFTKPGGAPVVRTEADMLNRSKFYLSLGSADGNPDKLRGQTTFLVDLVKSAMERGIDISWKTMDHNYDQPCIYTAKPRELAPLLTEMYNSGRYPMGMWNDVDRFFQTALKGVSNKHIAVVQEPVEGFRGQSHSNRIQLFAKLLSGPGIITEEDYREAARKCGLRPDELGFLSKEGEAEYLEGGRSKMLKPSSTSKV